MSIDSENIVNEMDSVTPVSDSPELQLHESDSADAADEMRSDCETKTQSLQVDLQMEAAPLTGYELVADMMRRQDAVIAEIDDLNHRIESAIKEITDARKLEEAALEAVVTDENATDKHVEETLELTSPVRQAA
ncbi:MAG: hypothetical protein ACI87E_002475 [Mariniblastus sp.]|jgi:hypothetical protein